MLGFSVSEFWDLSWGEFHAADYFQQQVDERWDLRFGVVDAAVRNAFRGKDSEAAYPGQSFGYPKPEPPDPEEEEMTPEETAAHLTRFFSQFSNQREKVGKISREKIR